MTINPQDTLSDQDWARVPAAEMDWAFLMAEADKVGLSRESPLLAAPDFADFGQCTLRRELLVKIRFRLLEKLPASTNGIA